MGFSTLDAVIVVTYLIGITAFGILAGGKQHTTRDYFLGRQQIPWWAVCFAVVATETSALTFIGIPGIAYVTNLNFLQLALGYIFGRIIISYLLLPSYFKGNLATAYGFLNSRFGGPTRNFASVVFLITRIGADGVRLYATAIPLKLVSGLDYPTAIGLTAFVTLLYTSIGGVKAVIWMDVVQMFIYIGGAVAAVAVLGHLLPDGIDGAVESAAVAGKLSILNFDMGDGIGQFFHSPYNFIASVIGGMFLSMASHGTDQLIVQRLLSTDSLQSSKKALIMSGVIVFFQFALFLGVGLLLYEYYQGLSIDQNEVFPKFIMEDMPSGLSGVIIAGLFAASMSTLAGSINSLSSSTVLDLYKPYRGKNSTDQSDVRFSRIVSFVWTVVLVISALFFMHTTHTVVELALKIASFTYGGLLGTFFLGVLFKTPKQRDAIVGFAAGLLVMVFLSQADIAWTWYTFVGSGVTLVVGWTSSLFRRRPQETTVVE